jgi:hypothetical protein
MRELGLDSSGPAGDKEWTFVNAGEILPWLRICQNLKMV